MSKLQTAGQARGRVRAIYEHLQIAVLDKQTGTETGLDPITSREMDRLVLQVRDTLGTTMAEFLERNPNALITGKKRPGNER